MAGSIITLADGSKMTSDFRKKFPNETKAAFYSSNVFKDLMGKDFAQFLIINDNTKKCQTLLQIDFNQVLYLERTYLI